MNMNYDFLTKIYESIFVNVHTSVRKICFAILADLNIFNALVCPRIRSNLPDTQYLFILGPRIYKTFIKLT